MRALQLDTKRKDSVGCKINIRIQLSAQKLEWVQEMGEALRASEISC